MVFRIHFTDSCKFSDLAAQGPALRGGLLIAREGFSKSEIGSPQGAEILNRGGRMI